MKKGKILTNPLIRSVLRHPFVQHEAQALARDGAVLYNNNVPQGGALKDEPLQGVNESPKSFAFPGVVVPSAAIPGAAVNTTVYGGEGAEALAFYRSLNSALAAGIRPECVLLSLTLPAQETEPALSARMARFQELAKAENLVITGGHTTVSDHVTLPVLTVIISGGFAPGYSEGRRPSPEDALMMTGFAGECGAAVLADACREKLSERFSGDFLEGAAFGYSHLSVRGTSPDLSYLSVRSAVEILMEEGAVMHDVSEGGVFSALYTFAEGCGCGFTAELKKIPIRQETIEICDFLDMNPYELLSTGALLFSVRDGERVRERLEKNGIPAVIIGSVTEGRQKILLRGEEERFLERPAQDPLMRLPDFG